jgi:hypothetical protein
MVYPVAVVLTIKNRFSLKDADGHLRDSWKRLTRRKEFKLAFRGGFVFEESTHSDKYGWHCHLHCLLDGRMDQKRLAALWLECTGDSMICHISKVRDRNRAQAIQEVCKYPCKLSDINGRPDLVREYTEHFRGRRLAWSFGTCYGVMKQIEIEIREARKQEQDDDQEGSEAAYCPYCRAFDTLHLRLGQEGKVSTWLWSDCVQVRGGWWIRGPSPGGGVPVPDWAKGTDLYVG